MIIAADGELVQDIFGLTMVLDPELWFALDEDTLLEFSIRPHVSDNTWKALDETAVVLALDVVHTQEWKHSLVRTMTAESALDLFGGSLLPDYNGRYPAYLSVSSDGILMGSVEMPESFHEQDGVWEYANDSFELGTTSALITYVVRVLS